MFMWPRAWGVCSKGNSGGGHRPGSYSRLCHLCRKTPTPGSLLALPVRGSLQTISGCGHTEQRVPKPVTTKSEEGLVCRTRAGHLAQRGSWALETNLPFPTKVRVCRWRVGRGEEGGGGGGGGEERKEGRNLLRGLQGPD